METMNDSADNLALRKQLLQARSALCRLRIRHQLDEMQGVLSWTRAAATAVNVLPIGSAVLGLALYGAAHSRLARLAALAARALMLARLASVVIRRIWPRR